MSSAKSRSHSRSDPQGKPIVSFCTLFFKTKSKTSTKRNGGKIHPCLTPDKMSNGGDVLLELSIQHDVLSQGWANFLY